MKEYEIIALLRDRDALLARSVKAEAECERLRNLLRLRSNMSSTIQQKYYINYEDSTIK